MDTGMVNGTDDGIVKSLANEMRKTAVRNILSYCEAQSWWRKLTRQEQLDLRSAVYDKTNAYHDFIVGVIRVTDQESRNPAAVEALATVIESQQRIERRLGTG